MQGSVSPAFITVVAAAAILSASAGGATATERDQQFFRSVEGMWSGPGEVVAGKYKGTRFVCNLKGTTPLAAAGMTLDGTCRVGVFSQKMSATVEKLPRTGYHGKFLDGASGKGLDIVAGAVDGRRVVFSLNRKSLHGTMVARLPTRNTMNVTIAVRVNDAMVPVVGVSLRRQPGSGLDELAQQ